MQVILAIVLIASPLAASSSVSLNVVKASAPVATTSTSLGNVTIHGVRPNIISQARLVGKVSPSRIIHFSLVLNYDSSAETYVQSIYDPTSPNYHQFITPQSFADKFGPTPSEYQNIVNWLQSNNVNVTFTAPDRLVVEGSATVRTLEKALNITFSSYQYGIQTFYANDVDPQVPSTIGRSIRGFVGFHNLTFVTPGAVTYNPTQIRTAYDSTYLLPPNIGYTGSGRTIDILDAYNYPDLLTDLNAFDSAFSLPAPAIAVVSIGSPSTCPTPPANQGSWCLETALDTQWAHATAPGATLHIILVADNTDNSLLSGINYVVNTDLTTGGIFSNSWGAAEMCTQFLVTFQCDPSFVNNVHPLLLQAASQGITTFFASGDNGAYMQGCSSLGCSSTLTVEYPASDPYVTAVGGTSLNSISGPSETAWSGSGGGISAVYPEPSYQSTYFTLTGRGVPDVSMDADPNTGVYVYCNQGTTGCSSGSGAYGVGGTSLATPLWAGSVALIEQAISANLGYLNPLIYQIYGTSEYNKDFHDVTSGNNGHYSAGTGWDAVTGLGSPDLFKMAQNRGMTAASLNPTSVQQDQTVAYSGSGFSPSAQVQVVIWNDGSGFVVGTPTASNSGSITGSFFVGTNILPGQRRVTFQDSSSGFILTKYLQVSSPVTQTLTATVTVTMTQTSTLYSAVTTQTVTSYTSTSTSISTIPTVTTVVLVPSTSTVQNTQYQTSFTTTTVTSYTSTSTSTSIVPTVMTVVLVPVTSTVQGTQYQTSLMTTTVTSYTSTSTSTSTIPAVTTVTIGPATSTIQTTQIVTSTGTSTVTGVTTTTITSYTGTQTSTSTTIVVTTVTTTSSFFGESLLALLGVLGLAVRFGFEAEKGRVIPEVLLRLGRRCLRS